MEKPSSRAISAAIGRRKARRLKTETFCRLPVLIFLPPGISEQVSCHDNNTITDILKLDPGTDYQIIRDQPKRSRFSLSSESR